MQLLHGPARTHASFDDPDLVSRAGLVPVMALAQRAGLGGLVADHVRPGGPCGVNAQLKVPCLVAGMAAGADSIDDMNLLRHGALPDLFGGIRAPSTLGSHLRSFTWGNVRQLEKVNCLLLGELARRAPLLPGRDTLAFVDIDAMQKRVYGRRKQGAAFGHTKIQGKSLLVRGLNALAATICTPLGAPVIAAVRPALDVKVAAAIAAIPETAWIPVRYPRAIWDDQLSCWISDAQVAEIPYTAFTSKKGQAITARLIVRRVRD